MTECGVVQFSYPDWIAAYPEFAQVGQPQAQQFFNRACLYCDNTPPSPIQNLFERTILLNMVTAHVAFLFASLNGQAPRELVGRIGNATEGSVSVGTVYTNPTTDLQAWFSQSSYGAAYWAATLKYRTAFYLPPPVPVGFNGRAGVFGLLPLGRRH